MSTLMLFFLVIPPCPMYRAKRRTTYGFRWSAAIRLVVITRDQRIRYRPVEKAAWKTYGVRGFVLTGRASQSTRDSLTILTRHWVTIERIVTATTDGPWMFAVTAAGLRAIDLG